MASQYEHQVIDILKKHGVPFVREKTFTNLKKGKYRFDFFIHYKGRDILLEVDSELHYSFIKFFHKTKNGFERTKGRDRQKNKFALASQIALYRIPYYEMETIKTVEDLLDFRYLVRSEYHNDYVIERRKKNNG